MDLVDMELTLRFLLVKPRVLFPAMATFVMCSSHSQSSCRVAPRYLALDDDEDKMYQNLGDGKSSDKTPLYLYIISIAFELLICMFYREEFRFKMPPYSNQPIWVGVYLRWNLKFMKKGYGTCIPY